MGLALQITLSLLHSTRPGAAVMRLPLRGGYHHLSLMGSEYTLDAGLQVTGLESMSSAPTP